MTPETLALLQHDHDECLAAGCMVAELIEDLTATRAALARAEQANAQLRDGLYVSPVASRGTTTIFPPMCRGCLMPKGGWPNPQQWGGEHGRDCWVERLLAAATATAAGESEGGR